MIPARPLTTGVTAEVRVFEALERALPDEYTVLHSVRWLEPPQRGSRRRPLDRETDFVIASPRRGAVIVEVKGGLVGSDSTTGRWHSRDRGGAIYAIKDAYEQARENCYSLLHVLQRSQGLPRDVGPIGYAACFPDGRVDGPRPIDAPAELTIEAADLSSPENLLRRFERLFGFWRGDGAVVMGSEAVKRLVELLSVDLTMRSPLGVEVDEADRAILALSQPQFALLDAMRRNRRVEAAGCAGSGKTVLAARKAQLLAGQGFETLLTCFNEPLGDHLRQSLAPTAGLEVRTYHQLCRKRAAQAGIQLQWPAGPDQDFFERRMPEALLASVDRLGPAFDAIVVDEGQDFRAGWWEPLLLLLTDPDGGVLFVFYDDNQALYDRPRGIPVGLIQLSLSQNWRNTRQIHAQVERFYRGEPIICMGPDGPVVEERSAAGLSELRKVLGQVLHRLIREEAVPASDVVVLTPRAAGASGLLGPLGGFHLVEQPLRPGEVRLSSIHRFKGLEAKVVVVAGIERGDRARPELMYVACSRARAHLVIITVP